MGITRVVIDAAAVAALPVNPDVVTGVLAVANAVADRMRERAPHRTGGGADSIHAEPDPDTQGAYRVGWDVQHFYMSFLELGTEDAPAEPFARPTVDEFNQR